jgi:hypothetical protein
VKAENKQEVVNPRMRRTTVKSGRKGDTYEPDAAFPPSQREGSLLPPPLPPQRSRVRVSSDVEIFS